MIYFCRAKGTNLYKIGYTKRDASERLKEWQAGCPHKLDLVGTIQGTRSDEKKLHDRIPPVGFALLSPQTTLLEDLAKGLTPA